MTARDQEEQDLRIELMSAQFEQAKANIDRLHQELRWEPYKALAVILAAVAAMSGVILGVAHLIH